MEEIDEVINRTTIIYNNRLIGFLERMEQEFKYDLPHLGDPHYTKKVYPRMFEFMKANVFAFDHSIPYHYRKHFKPNAYAIMVALCSDYSKYADWETLAKNIEKVRIPDDEEWEFQDNFEIMCCCSHVIKHVFIITLLDTKRNLVVGDTCVTKNLLVTEEVKNEIKALKQTSIKRAKLRKTHRQCPDCREWNIKIDEPKFKKWCLQCWVTRINQKTR